MGYAVIVQKDGTFFNGKPEGAPTPELASIYSTRDEAEKRLAKLRADKGNVWEDADPVVDYDAARFPVGRLMARIKELEAAAKKDPYTVAAVDKARITEAEVGRLTANLQAAVEGRTAAEVSANRLRIERDDLARKLRRR